MKPGSSDLNSMISVDLHDGNTEKANETKQLTKQLTKELAKGGSIAFIGGTIAQGTTFALHIMLGRVLGAGSYGAYILGKSITGIAQSVALLGLNQGVVRYGAIYQGAHNKARIKGTIFSALAITFLLSLTVTVLLFIFAETISERFFDNPDLARVLHIFACAIPFSVLTLIILAFAKSLRQIGYQQGIGIFRSVATLVLAGGAFLLGFRLSGAIYGFLA